MNQELIKKIFNKWLKQLQTGEISQKKSVKFFIAKIQKINQYYLDFFEEVIVSIIKKIILEIQKGIPVNSNTIPPKILLIGKTIDAFYKQSWISKHGYLLLKQKICQIHQRINRQLTPIHPSMRNLHIHNPQQFNERQNNRHIQGYDCLHQLSMTNLNETMQINKTNPQYERILTESLVGEVNGFDCLQPSIYFPPQLSQIYCSEQSTFDEQLS